MLLLMSHKVREQVLQQLAWLSLKRLAAER